MRVLLLVLLVLLTTLPSLADGPTFGTGGTAGVTPLHASADSGGNAGNTDIGAVGVGTYVTAVLSLTEVVDTTLDFNTDDPDYLCYTGASTESVMITSALAFQQFGGAPALVTTTFAKGLTGVLGTPFGEAFPRDMGSTAKNGMGAVDATTTLATNECISMQQKSDTASTVTTITGLSVHITQPGVSGGGINQSACSEDFAEFRFDGGTVTENITLDTSISVMKQIAAFDDSWFTKTTNTPGFAACFTDVSDVHVTKSMHFRYDCASRYFKIDAAWSGFVSSAGEYKTAIGVKSSSTAMTAFDSLNGSSAVTYVFSAIGFGHHVMSHRVALNNGDHISILAGNVTAGSTPLLYTTDGTFMSFTSEECMRGSAP